MQTKDLNEQILPIEDRIMTIRGRWVMLDRDLAELYGVETKRLNEQVKRNLDRFPESFMFRLSKEEMNQLVADCDRLKNMKHSSALPCAFTEQGVAMLSAVLHSPIAVKVSINIMNAFVLMRRNMLIHSQIVDRLEKVERKQFLMEESLEKVFSKLDNTPNVLMEGIFYEGQIFDSYVFVSDLIKSAQTRLVLIDNYIDESVLLMLSKRASNVSAEIRTSCSIKGLQLDIQKHNLQYPPIKMKRIKNIHDRFLIVDNTVYHIGASIKDLGKKLFAFSKMSIPPQMVLL